MQFLLTLVFSATPRQYKWADSYNYPIRTESNSQKINYILLAEDLYKTPCGRQTAGWVRTMWHDFGTFDMIKQDGGLDGSILFELNRLENTRLDTHTFHLSNKASEFNVGLADTIALSAIIAIRKCGGPKVPFYYGREDSMKENPKGRFIFTNATFVNMTNNMMVQNGLSFPQFVAAIGVGHTIGKLNKVYSIYVGFRTYESRWIRYNNRYAN